jgi:holo-[acyl-carrier protein] synthase
MILGLGTDLLDMRRLDTLLQRYGTRLEQRLFTHQEQALAQTFKVNNPHRALRFYGKRFAAKEAFAKACGTGFGAVLSWTDLDLASNQSKPSITLSHKARLNLIQFWQKSLCNPPDNFDKIACHISISDEWPYAYASAIIEVKP